MNKLKVIGFIVFTMLIALTLIVLVWFRSNTAQVDPFLNLEICKAINDGMHNFNTDTTYFKNYFYIVHASSPYHFATPECKLIVWRSKDCKQWSQLQEIPHKGWLLWRPKTFDGKRWYVPAYWHEHGKAMLFTVTDSINWQPVSLIYEGDRCDETAIEFLPDGTMISTERLEYSDSWLGDSCACTKIQIAKPPYTQWTGIKDYSTRLDGPALFAYNGKVYAIGRRNPYAPGLLNKYGSILAKMPTSLWLVTPEKLVWLLDVPSAGDTSYAGYVLQGNTLYFSYYTSDIHHDYPWIVGMITRSPIMMGKLIVNVLEQLANTKQ